LIDINQINTKREMNINMKFSTRLPLGNIGDSKMFLSKLMDSDEYIITIQNIESSDIAISGIKNDKYEYISEDGTSPNKLSIIGSITEKQLAELGSILTNKFPAKDHDE